MANEILHIDVEKIHVSKGVIQFNEFESLKQQAIELASNIEQVEVTDENIKVSKKMLSAVNKRVKEMEDRRISIKKEMLEPYNHFEQQVKEIVTIVKDADNIVRNQIRELEEKEREEKRNIIAKLFEKRIKQYSFNGMFTFENFIKPNHLNKTTSMKTIETDMVEWLEKTDSDLKVIRSLPNAEAVLTEYYDTKDLATAINIVNDYEERKKILNNLVKPVKKEQENVFTITIYDEKDLTTLEMFMQLKHIKYTLEKVEK